MIINILKIFCFFSALHVQASDGGTKLKSTLDYYDENAESYAMRTWAIDVSDQQNRFINMINPSSHILDLGCGAGRDTKKFRDMGFKVTGVDGSSKLSEIAKKYSNANIINMQYCELEYQNIFDAVWSCASLLHIDIYYFRDVLNRILRSLKNGGIFHLSLKEGTGEYTDSKGRYFYLHSFDGLITEILSMGGFSIDYIDRNIGPGDQPWLNVYLVKKPPIYNIDSQKSNTDLYSELIMLMQQYGATKVEVESIRLLKKDRLGGFSGKNVLTKKNGSSKLIRDKIANEIVETRPDELSQADNCSELHELLMDKFLEEKNEFLISVEKSFPREEVIEELADIAEVIFTIQSLEK